ncbi:hypothetical protein ACFL1H_02610, partial [Nanoarchaeota archaeon]
KEIKELGTKIKTQQKDLDEKEKVEQKFYSKFKSLFNQKSQFTEELQKAESHTIIKEEKIRNAEQRKNGISIEDTKIKVELGSLQEDLTRYEGVKIDKKADESKIKRTINDFERMAENLGSVNMRALEVYDSVEKEYKSLLQKRETLKLEKDDVVKMIDEIEGRKKELFIKAYDMVNGHFQDIFLKLSSKGEAFLELEDPDQPFEAGVNIKVRISGTKFLDIRSLSGGEKTMTALAFIFAIQEHEPATFYIMDEVDAALDKRNATLLANLVKKYCDNAQYIVISHNDSVISEANKLYGVSMNNHGMSKVVSLKL